MNSSDFIVITTGDVTLTNQQIASFNTFGIGIDATNAAPGRHNIYLTANNLPTDDDRINIEKLWNIYPGLATGHATISHTQGVLSDIHLQISPGVSTPGAPSLTQAQLDALPIQFSTGIPFPAYTGDYNLGLTALPDHFTGFANTGPTVLQFWHNS
jgi:hypothetical protein